jgi:hypothetical protein
VEVTEFCSGVFNMNKYRSTLQRVAEVHEGASDDSVLVAHEAELSSMCGPCISNYIRIMNRYSTFDLVESGIEGMEKMCVQGTIDEQQEFCYPRYRSRRRATKDDGQNKKAQTLCADDMGNCAQNMLIRDAAQEDENHTAVRELDYMCLRRISSKYTEETAGKAMLCADQMAAHVGGYGADKTFTGEEYQAPSPSCDLLENVNDTCTWGCQRTYTPERDNFGCCYQTIRDFYELLEHENVDSVFRSSDLVGDECNRPPDPTCDVLNFDAGVRGTMVVDTPVSYLRDQDASSEITQALIKDIERAIGRRAAGITIRGYRYFSASATTVDFVVVSQDLELATELVAAFNITRDAGKIVNINIDRLYFNLP